MKFETKEERDYAIAQLQEQAAAAIRQQRRARRVDVPERRLQATADSLGVVLPAATVAAHERQGEIAERNYAAAAARLDALDNAVSE